MITTKLSKIQEQFWYLSKMAPKSAAYNIPSVNRLDKLPDISLLEQALNKIIERYELLRTQFEMVNSQLNQIIKTVEDSAIKLNYIKINQAVEAGKIPNEIYNEVSKPFDLEKAPLFRASIFQFQDEIYFVLVFHHLVIDLQSKSTFENELNEIYSSLLHDKEPNLLNPVKQYREFSEWYNEWLETEQAKKLTAEWVKELPDPNTVINLPVDKDRPSINKLEGSNLYFNFTTELSKKINDFASRNSSNSYAVLLSCYAIFLHKITQQNDIVIGVPLSNRKNEKFQDTFGVFINTVPIALDFSIINTFSDVLKQVRKKMVLAHRKQEIPFSTIVGSSGYKHDSSRNPYYQCGFTYEPLIDITLEGVDTEPLCIERKGAQLELFLIFCEKDGKFNFTFEYSTSIFNSQTIERWKEVYIKIIESIIEPTDSEINKLNIIPEKEWNLLKEWNNTSTRFEDNLCIQKKFESQVEKNPENIALDYYGKTLTYRGLNEHANRLAHYLIEKGVKVEDHIGICLHRSFEMMIAIFATLKAGATYVPLEPSAPKERNEMVIDDAEIKFILTTTETSLNLNKTNKNIFIGDILTKYISDKTSNPEVNVKPNNLAYIIYTSGSTGRPKGVMIEHRSVLNKISWIQKTYPINSGDEIIQKTPITFDVSVWELFWWTFNGGKLVILKPNGEKDPKSIIERIKANNPSVIIFVPSVFALFVDYLISTKQEDCLSGLKWIVQIGEALTPALVNKYNKMMGGRKAPILVNTYGPTEATVAVSWYECPTNTDIEKIFIGKPIDNTGLFIINQNGNIQPLGIQGELVITGVNLARGYQAAPELTADKFIQISLPDGNEVRAYKTGDLAKWDTCGEIDFIGRVDNQVKLNGIRIELGDIEAKLLEHTEVNEAAVIVSETGNNNKTLIGYIVPSNGEKDLKSSITKFLQSKLPPYMIPNHFVEMEKMPLTTSGKINRKLLPAPVFNSQVKHVEPVSIVEKQLVDIWKKTLSIDKIGISDNFFELGGNSLLAVSLATNIQNNIHPDIDVLKIMEYPNIKALAGFITELNNPSAAKNDSINQRAVMRKKSQRMARVRRF